MQILKVVQAYYPFQAQGGPVVKVRALARGLARRGHQVTVLTADLGLGKIREPTLALERFDGGWRGTPDGIETYYLKTLAQYRALTINPALLHFCRNRISGFDIAHIYGLYDLLGPAASHCCRENKIPYVVEPMGMYRPIDRSLRRKRLWHGLFGSRMMRDAARIVATSELEYQEFAEGGLPEKKLVIRYNGVDAAAGEQSRGSFRAKWSIAANEPLILFLSRLIPRKGADLLIEAFASVCRERGWLAIVGPEGEPGYRRYLENKAKDCGVESRVLFTGPLYGDEKERAVADADLFVLPSRYENFANVAAESIAAGVPVIVSRCCGIHSLVEGRAGLVIAPEKEELEAALARILSDQTLYSKMKEGCAGVAAMLNWDHLAAQMEGYYADARGERGIVH